MHGAIPTRVALPRHLWEAQALAHHARVAPIAQATADRRSRGLKHPVWDFLFTYYTFTPSRLLAWVPGLLEDQGTWRPALSSEQTGPPALDWTPPPIPVRLPALAAWVAQLCQEVLSRPPWLGCYCLHEWAMVYRLAPSQVRHQSLPLRLSPELTNQVVESQPLTCTHYDAFRFFTPEARPRNSHNPSLATRQSLEQPGCLHANMDLYKWSTKLWPWIGSNLVGETFALAARARTLDMRASPYDASALGFPPIHIESPAGRTEFVEEQRAIATAATLLRQRLHTAALTLSTTHPGP